MSEAVQRIIATVKVVLLVWGQATAAEDAAAEDAAAVASACEAAAVAGAGVAGTWVGAVVALELHPAMSAPMLSITAARRSDFGIRFM